MKMPDIIKQLANRINQPHVISTYFNKVAKGAYNKGVEDTKLNFLCISGVINWVAYDWNKPSTYPPKAGRYLIYRSKCDKLHFEQWNGSGWSSSNNDCTHWTLMKPPCL